VNNDYQLVQELTLDQYAAVLGDALYRDTLLNSVLMALATTVVSVSIGVPLAWAMSRSFAPRMRILLIVGLILPGWVSVLIRTYSMNLVIGESGLLNWLLLASGMIETPLRILFTKGAVVLGLVYIYLPYTLIPIFAAIERLDPAVLEAAENLGAGPVRRFRRIVLPLIMPGIVAGSIITFIPALGEYLVPNLLGGLQGIMYGNLIVTAFQSYDWPLGSALSVVLLVGIGVTLFAFSRLTDLKRSLLAE
ncbi:MAG TPA: ABC transporter permease, partial [Aestuariivirgaceae bacterium]|nr:ABC transporter permease [Aestuariivirgaceae bacterium]